MSEKKSQEVATATRVTSHLRPSLELGQPCPEVTIGRPTTLTWCFAGLSALCVCAMVFAGILSGPDCRVRPIRLALGHDQNISIALPANTPCTIAVLPGNAILDGITVDAPAEHGTLTPRGHAAMVYRPRAGFRGRDSFDFSLHGGSSAERETSIIRVRATIE